MGIDDIWLAGADGCPGGWVVAFVRPAGHEMRVRVVARFAEIFSGREAPAIVAVDMPIGLPERAGADVSSGRTAEKTVRKLLHRRRPSVFSIPSRNAVYAELGPFKGQAEIRAAHQQACLIARQTSTPPKGVPMQAFMIFPKIREVDKVLRENQSFATFVFETHPEVAFWRLNCEREMSESKTCPPGLAERRKVLIANGFTDAAINERPPTGARTDDLLDAFACAAIARRILAGVARPFPDPPEKDKYGLPMAIWA